MKMRKLKVATFMALPFDTAAIGPVGSPLETGANPSRHDDNNDNDNNVIPGVIML